MLAEGLWGMKRTDSAVRRAVQNATVVKKPKAFCTLTSVECILGNMAKQERNVYVHEQSGGLSEHLGVYQYQKPRIGRPLTPM